MVDVTGRGQRPRAGVPELQLGLGGSHLYTLSHLDLLQLIS